MPSISRWYSSLVSVLAVVCLAAFAQGQTVVNSASRSISVNSAFGSDSATFASTGQWTRTLNIAAGTCTIVSDASPTGLTCDFTFNVGSPPPNALPGAEVFYSANITIPQDVQLTYSRLVNNASSNFSFSGRAHHQRRHPAGRLPRARRHLHDAVLSDRDRPGKRAGRSLAAVRDHQPARHRLYLSGQA